MLSGLLSILLISRRNARNPAMSCTSCFAVRGEASVGPVTRLSPRLDARASSRVEYECSCVFEAHREFFRITEVTDWISDARMCFRETDSVGTLWAMVEAVFTRRQLS